MRYFIPRLILACVGLVFTATGSPTVVAQQTAQQAWPTVADRAVRPPESWESESRKFEAADKQAPPPQSGVVFVGSSSIVRWDLAKYFPELGPKAINRGFGGSVSADATYYADRIVTPYKPRI